MEILKTKNYDAFKFVTSNREVDQGHVKKLRSSISNKNLLHLNPIIVDEDMTVIDGQHRLEACKQLECEVFYVISNKIKEDDLRILNSVQKSWTTMDYINYYTVAGKSEFIEFSRLINQYPKMYVSALLALATTWTKDNDIRNGRLKIDNIAGARSVCALIDKVASMGYEPFAYSSSLVAAIRKCYDNAEFDWDIFFKKLENNPRSFVKCSSKNEYLKMIEEVYNRYQSKNLINLTHKAVAIATQ